jgi:hypothetical protein
MLVQVIPVVFNNTLNKTQIVKLLVPNTILDHPQTHSTEPSTYLS